MKKYLESAQEFLDADRPVPGELLEKLSSREREMLTMMLKLKSELPQEMPNPPEFLFSEDTIPSARTGNPKKAVFSGILAAASAAAAVLLILAGISLNRSMETRRLLKEDTALFVEQLFRDDPAQSSFLELETPQGLFEDQYLSDLGL